MPQPTRDQVFISYSHKDRDWLEKLQIVLKPLIRKGLISIWDDTQIQAGEQWRYQIAAALGNARVAVLLVSPEFLASDFIADHELPPLLRAAQNEGLTILWLLIRDCLFSETEIADYQAAHDISRPLAMLASAEVDTALVGIARKINAAFTAPPKSSEITLKVHQKIAELECQQKSSRLPDDLQSENGHPSADRNQPKVNFSWRWFAIGCALLALALAIWGFSLGRLTEDPWRLLVWLLPLASGFAAAAFIGSVFVKARNFIPGIAVTATGGFAVWLITFFYLFPASSVSSDGNPSLTALSSTPNVVKIGDNIFLRSQEGSYVTTADTSFSHYWPRLGKNERKVMLKLLGNGPLRNGSVVQLQSLEDNLQDDKNVLGALADNRNCYYEKNDPNKTEQSWIITKCNPSNSALFYEDPIYLINVRYNARLTKTEPSGDHLTVKEGVDWWWALVKR